MNARICKILALFFLSCPIFVFAQNSNAVIKGTVRDSGGGIMQGAEVNLVNTGTDEHRTERTNKEGYFDFTALNPGEYEVTVGTEGFAAWSGKLTLRVAQEATLAPTLRVAGTKTSIDVVDVTPVIDRSDAILSDVKEAARIETLPLQNRNFLNILNFTPGVVANNFAGQGNSYTRVNGIPGGSLDYLVDGQTSSERTTNELQRRPQPLNTIQELKVTTSNGGAEYSRPGVVEVVTKSGTNEIHGQLFELNQISALNAHGYRKINRNRLTHNEFGGNIGGPIVLPKLYNGRNKTFFFVDAEGIRQRSALSETFNVPLPAWKTGDFSTLVSSNGLGTPITIYDPLTTRFDPVTNSYVRDPFPGNKIPDARINAVARKVTTYIPDPNVSTDYFNGNYQVPHEAGKDDSTLVTGKLDQVFGLNRLSARYTHVTEDQTIPGQFLNPRIRQTGGHNGAISFTEVITPRVVNEVRAGVQLFHSYAGPVPITPPITQTLGLPTYSSAIAWPGIDFAGPEYGISTIDRDNPKDSPNTTISAGDNLSWTLGRHELKFGVSDSYYAVTTIEQGQPGGDYQFTGLFTGLQDPAQVQKGDNTQAVPFTGMGFADFLLGETAQATLNTVPRFHTRQSDYAAYVQDNWRVSQRLTLNLGLRYEYWTPFKDKNGRSANLDFSKGGSPIVVTPGSGAPNVDPATLAAYQAGGLQFESAAAAGFPSDLWDMDKKNIAPRVGFAFQADPKTTFRGGYGFYYWAMPLIQYHQNTRHNAPFAYSLANNIDNINFNAAQLSFPQGPYANQGVDSRAFGQDFLPPTSVTVSENAGWSVLPWDPHYHPQRTQEYNVTMEHELPGHLGARISYVGTHSDHLAQYDPINALTPIAFAPEGATDQQRRKYAHFASSSTGSMDLLRWNGYGNSNILQTELKQQVNKDMIVQAFFVWQHVLTTSEGGNNSLSALVMQPAALDPSATDSQRLRALYANDSSLPQYTFSFNTHYILPLGHGKAFLNHSNGFTDRLVSGFNLSAFFYWRSGLFFSPFYTSGSSNGYVLAANANPALPKSQRTRKQWFNSSVQTADNPVYSGQTYIQRGNANSDQLSNIRRSALTGPGFNNLDTTISKITPITERVSFDLEAQMFNTYNHVNLNLPSTTGFIGSSVAQAAQSTYNGQRLIQLQGKIIF